MLRPCVADSTLYAHSPAGGCIASENYFHQQHRHMFATATGIISPFWLCCYFLPLKYLRGSCKHARFTLLYPLVYPYFHTIYIGYIIIILIPK
jgi:hypothetical protein